MSSAAADVPRAIETLRPPQLGAVVATGRREVPGELVDADGEPVAAVSAWLLELTASDYSAATIRSYAYDLLAWQRFCAAVDVTWRQATRWEVRDFVRWYRASPNTQRARGQSVDEEHRPTAGTPNSVTGKPYLPDGHARASINHRLSVRAQRLLRFRGRSRHGTVGEPCSPHSRGT